MVAPSVPCSLLVPVAPHSLSFRWGACFRAQPQLQVGGVFQGACRRAVRLSRVPCQPASLPAPSHLLCWHQSDVLLLCLGCRPPT